MFFLSAPEQTVEQTNHQDAGDLSHHRSHYAVTVKIMPCCIPPKHDNVPHRTENTEVALIHINSTDHSTQISTNP